MTRTQGLNKETAICFAYYDYRHPERQDLTYIVAALIKQICQKRESIPEWLLQSQLASRSPSTASKEESFLSLAECSQNIFLVIDALDECPRSSRSNVIGFIFKMISSLPCAKILVTSRRESDIVRSFEQHGGTIQIKADSVAADIERYACSEVDKLCQGYNGKKLYLSSAVCKQRIVETLTEKADGMYVVSNDLSDVYLRCDRFLWVNLQLESLCQISEARKDRLVEDALDHLPRGLDNTYARIIERIDCQQECMRDLALRCLSWVFYAQRPLRRLELQHALAIAEDFSKPQGPELIPVDAILEACGNLITIERKLIQPIHFSVYEYFTKSRCSVSQGSFLEILGDSKSVHVNLTRVCLQYIDLQIPEHPCENQFDLWQRLYQRPLAVYAAQYFDYHAIHCVTANKEIQDLIEALLRKDGLLLAAILQIRYLPQNFSPFEGRGDHREFYAASFPVSASTIIYATHLYDDPQLREHWVGHDLPRFALHSASTAGLLNVVERLVSRGCKVEEVDDQGNRAIHYAARRGHLAIVEILINNGAYIDAQGRQFGSALQAASIGGCISTVKSLIGNGAAVNAQGGYFGNALQAASFQGNYDIVKLLIEHGAHVNACTGNYGNSLQAASARSHKNVVQLLIDHCADVNARGG